MVNPCALKMRGEPIAMLTAMQHARGTKVKMPDFAARQRVIWGDRMFSEAEVIAMREAELEGEEG